MSEPKPDWSKDDQIKHFRRGKLDLPFTTTERSEADTQKRLLVFAAATAVVVTVVIFLLLLWNGMYPELYRDPRITDYGSDRSVLYWLPPGAGLIGAVAFLVILSPVFFGGPPGQGHPYTFEATEHCLTIRTLHGQTFTGAWADWRLNTYDVLTMPKGGQVLSMVYLGIGGAELGVRVMDQRHQRRFMRMVAQKIAF